jgi:hypothetical protein
VPYHFKSTTYISFSIEIQLWIKYDLLCVWSRAKDTLPNFWGCPLPRALWFGSKCSIQTDDLPMNNPLSLIEFIISPLSSPHFGLGIFWVLHEKQGSPQTSRLAQNPPRFAQFHLNMTKPTNPRTNPKIEQIWPSLIKILIELYWGLINCFLIVRINIVWSLDR